MKFVHLYRGIYALSITSILADFAVTYIGMEKFTVWLETNPYILLLMRYMPAKLALLSVTAISLLTATLAYLTCSDWLNEHPYKSKLKNVATYLTTAEQVKGRDIAIFVTLTLYILLAWTHITGAWSWLKLLLF